MDEKVMVERTPEFLESEGKRLARQNAQRKANQENRTYYVVDRGEPPYPTGKHRFMARRLDKIGGCEIVCHVEPVPEIAERVAESKAKRKAQNLAKDAALKSAAAKKDKDRLARHRLKSNNIKSPIGRFLKNKDRKKGRDKIKKKKLDSSNSVS